MRFCLLSQEKVVMSSEVVGDGQRRALALQLLDLVRDFVLMSGRSIAGAGDVMKKDCTDLIRRIALLIHLAEEITNFCSGSRENFEALNDDGSSCSSSWLDCLSEVVGAIQAAKRLLYTALTFSVCDEEGCATSTVSSSFIVVFLLSLDYIVCVWIGKSTELEVELPLIVITLLIQCSFNKFLIAWCGSICFDLSIKFHSTFSLSLYIYIALRAAYFFLSFFLIL